MAERTIRVQIQADTTAFNLEIERAKREQAAIRQNQSKIYTENIYLFTQMAQLASMWFSQFRDVMAIQALSEALQVAQMGMYMRRMNIEIAGLALKGNMPAVIVMRILQASYGALYVKAKMNQAQTKAAQTRAQETQAYLQRVNKEMRSWS